MGPRTGARPLTPPSPYDGATSPTSLGRELIFGASVCARLEGWATNAVSAAHASRQPLRGLLSMRCCCVEQPTQTTGLAPPSTLMATPVMKEPASEHRKQAMRANSSDLPMRPIGMRPLAMPSRNCS